MDCFFFTWPISFLRIEDSRWNRFYSSHPAVHCFDDGYVGKQSVAWKEYRGGVLVEKKNLRESMDRCTGRCDITEMMLKRVLKPYS